MAKSQLMTDHVAATDRAAARLCRCHGQPMDRSGGTGGWHCAVKRRARQLAAYHANPFAANYARTRRLLRARISRKRERIAELEADLAALKVELIDGRAIDTTR